METYRTMPKQSISLNGAWNIAGHDMSAKLSKELLGTVPGHIHVDLLKEGIIKDPFWRNQADDCQWVEDWSWSYTREFDISEDFDNSWTILKFDGLDTYAEIILNGENVGHTANMFVPHSFEVGDKLHPGKNTLQVNFSPYKKMIENKPLEPYPAAFFTSERVHVRRMQCTFHWDWVNRFVSAGIWRSVTLCSYDAARIKDLFVYTSSIGSNSAVLNVEFETEKRTEKNPHAILDIIDPAGDTVWSGNLDISDEKHQLTINLENPKLWWPNEMGDQPLYKCNVTLYAQDGRKLDFMETNFGIRTVRVEQIEDVPGSDEWKKTINLRTLCPWTEKNGQEPGSSFTLIVNDQRVFCKGGNWVPADPFPSRITPEHYERLIKLAKDSNMNLLRCWGGGIYESDAFWDACNRHGIMVSQDFQMACAIYPEDDPDFMDMLKEEYPKAIRMLRNHPSLAWWTGDNECGMSKDFDDPNYGGKKIADEIAGPACSNLDPSRPFMPTSPYGGKPNLSLTIGDCHFSAMWDHDLHFIAASDMTDYVERIGTVGRFMSESAIFGAPPMRSLLKFMSPEDISDPSRQMWEYHTKDNPHKPGNINITLHGMLERMAEKLFGHSNNIDMQVRKMEYVQYEWIRLAVESARRNKWYCSGIQFWMYNDCWPASGWSIVDYYGFPKAGYYAMKRVSKNVIASIKKEGNSYQVWVCNDILEPVTGEIELRVQPWVGDSTPVTRSQFVLNANTSQLVLEISQADLKDQLDLDAVLVCNLTSDSGSDRAFWYDGMPHQMKMPNTKLHVTQENAGNHGKIVISTKSYARVVTLEADLDFSDNYFDLLPGEARTIEWSSPNGNFNEDISVICWNQEK